MIHRFDRETYFNNVRMTLFDGSLSQRQVDGQGAILAVWEIYAADHDVRWLAYFLATAYWETAQEMWPIEEYGKGEGHPYGEVDPETGQTYHGRGLVQCTWRENYTRADDELGLTGDDRCEWHADQQLDPVIAARTGYLGMVEGWFRSDGGGPQTLGRYFNDTTEDPYGAREIINGDKTTVPSWADGVSIGKLIERYYDDFLDALSLAATAASLTAAKTER